MYGGLSREGLRKLENQIDIELKGRDPKSPDLEAALKALIEKYSYEVQYHNITHKKAPYQNKYGTKTPSYYGFELSLANFLANGVPVENSTTIVPQGSHPVTKESMSSFIGSCEALLKGTASLQDITRVRSYEPKNAPSLNESMAPAPVTIKRKRITEVEKLTRWSWDPQNTEELLPRRQCKK